VYSLSLTICPIFKDGPEKFIIKDLLSSLTIEELEDKIQLMISEKYNFKNKKLNRVKLYFKENINDNKKTI
jgi:hypothetical protein